jgi:hypothetical protein
MLRWQNDCSRYVQALGDPKASALYDLRAAEETSDGGLHA